MVGYFYAANAHAKPLFFPFVTGGGVQWDIYFRTEISISNQNRTQEKHNQLLANLLLAIGIFQTDVPITFKPIAWASGNNKTGK